MLWKGKVPPFSREVHQLLCQPLKPVTWEIRACVFLLVASCPQVSTPEAAEVMAVNALAPFILNSRLIPLMRRDRTPLVPPSPCDAGGDVAGERSGGGGGGSSVRGGNGGHDESAGAAAFPASSSAASGSSARPAKSSPRSLPVEPRFIINVSAMEGKFYRHKTSNHPHTNMAKVSEARSC